LLILRSPSNILGNSDGLTGSTAIFSTELVLNLKGRKICAYNTYSKTTDSIQKCQSVAELKTKATPSHCNEIEITANGQILLCGTTCPKGNSTSYYITAIN